MVFLLVLIIFLMILLIFITSKIRFEIKRFEYSLVKKEHVNPKYKIQLSWFVFGKLPVIKIDIDKTKLDKLKMKEKIISVETEIIQGKKKIDKNILNVIKKIKIYVKKLELKIDIGTENAALTSMIIPALSSILAIFLRKKIKSKEEQFFIVTPIYKNQNYLNIELSGIFEIKMNHIINIIHLLLRKNKKGVRKYERTSNRRPYDYSYE